MTQRPKGQNEGSDNELQAVSQETDKERQRRTKAILDFHSVLKTELERQSHRIWPGYAYHARNREGVLFTRKQRDI